MTEPVDRPGRWTDGACEHARGFWRKMPELRRHKREGPPTQRWPNTGKKRNLNGKFYVPFFKKLPNGCLPSRRSRVARQEPKVHREKDENTAKVQTEDPSTGVQLNTWRLVPTSSGYEMFRYVQMDIVICDERQKNFDYSVLCMTATSTNLALHCDPKVDNFIWWLLSSLDHDSDGTWKWRHLLIFFLDRKQPLMERATKKIIGMQFWRKKRSLKCQWDFA